MSHATDRRRKSEIEEFMQFAKAVKRLNPEQRRMLAVAMDDVISNRCTFEEIKVRLESDAQWQRRDTEIFVMSEGRRLRSAPLAWGVKQSTPVRAL